MSDAENNVHPEAIRSVFGKYYDDVIPPAVAAAFAILEATVFFNLFLLDPAIGSMLFWGSIAVATVSAGIYYTILCLQGRQRSYPLSFSRARWCRMSFSNIFGLLVVVYIVHDMHGFHADDAANEIFRFLLPEVSIPVIIILAMQYFKANLAALRHQPQGSLNNKDILPSLLIIRRLDWLLSRILMGVGVISAQTVVGMVCLMSRYRDLYWDQYISLIDICLYVFLMALVIGAFSCLLVMFFISLRPRPRQKKNKVVVEAVAPGEHTATHRQVLSEPLLGGQVDTLQNSESITIRVV
jgi:hypothetical protein